jgi:hypothetical protein
VRASLPTLQAFLLLASAGCASPTHLEDLKTPALFWERTTGLCSSWLAVDAEGILWVDPAGCEGDPIELTSRGKCEQTKLEALNQAFDALPANAGPELGACGGSLNRFSRKTSTTRIESRACGSRMADHLGGLQEPHLSAATRFLALP